MEGTLQVTHGRLIDQLRETPNAGKLFSYCEGAGNTHLRFVSYAGPADDLGETQCHVKGTDGAYYNLDEPGDVPWEVVKQDSPIMITIRLNTGHVFGQGEDAQTLLHEIDVHALAYLQFIEATRKEHDRRNIKKIWTAAIEGSSSGEGQHRRLGAGRQRGLSADVAAIGRPLGIEQELAGIQAEDIAEHGP